MARFSELSKRLGSAEDTAWGVHNDALDMQRRGEDVVVLSIGDPDFRTPEPIVDNAVSHLKVGRTHYSPALGELGLRRAVADYETRVSPHACSVDEVSIFPGVTPGIFAVMSCLLNPGDGVVVIDPCMSAMNRFSAHYRRRCRLSMRIPVMHFWFCLLYTSPSPRDS